MKNGRETGRFFVKGEKRALIIKKSLFCCYNRLIGLIFCVCVFLRLTVHGQVRRRFHLARRIGGTTREHAGILRIGRLDQEHGVIALLDHLQTNRAQLYNINRYILNPSYIILESMTKPYCN